MSGELSSINEDYEDDVSDVSEHIDIDSETNTRSGAAKASLMKRRLIDNILEQKRLDKLMNDFDESDLDDDFDDEE